MRILFLGPCRKQNRRTGVPYPPFDPETLSGSYLTALKAALRGTADWLRFAESNVIDAPHFAPGGREEKNPTTQDLLRNWEQFDRRVKRMNPDYIVAFGSNVRAAFAAADKTEYVGGHLYRRGRQRVVFSPHPSFIMVYRRKEMHKYISSLSSIISNDAARA